MRAETAVLVLAMLAACDAGMVSGQAGTCEGGQPCADAGTSPDAGMAPQALPTCDNIDDRLHDDFGIVIKPGTLAFEGLPSEDIGCEKRIKVYQMFMRAFEWEGYRTRLDPSDPFTMHLYKTSDPVTGGCSAYTPSAQAIQIRDLSECLRVVNGTDDPDFRRVATFLNHESGHIITNRHSSLKTKFKDAGLVQLDPKCYDQGFIKTYSLRSTNPVSESFAESLALFLWHKKVGRYATIDDFEAECPHTHEWMQTNVMGTHL